VNDEIIVRSDSCELAPSAEVTDRSIARETPSQPRMASRPEPQKTALQPVTSLFAGEQCRSMRSRWKNLQVGFVDEPRHAVEQADQLVSEAIRELATQFASEREKLEKQWHVGSDVSTEDLRPAFQRYRSFFERLLSV
jgi:hypothetical protein